MLDFIFYLFSFFLVGSAVMVISLRNTVHAVLFLIFAFFNAAALFVMLGAEFIAMTLIIVYVGAVAVLFLFVIMMLNIDVSTLRSGFLKNAPLGIALGATILAQMVFAITNSSKFLPAPTAITVADELSNTEQLGMVLYTDYVIAFQLAGIILLVAMIGAIVLTLVHGKDAKRQNIMRQVRRTKEECVELVDVKSGEGIRL